MIETTDEMLEAAEWATEHTDGDVWAKHRAAIAAVLALVARDLRAAIALKIRAELVCCDIYEWNQREGTARLFCDGPHSICYWGEAAAQIAEGTS